MRIFITGGTGYIGAALCRRLAADGHELRALVRPTSHREELEALGAECFVGDITDRESLRKGMTRADWVVHAAAELDFGAPRKQIEGANATGSKNVAALARETGVGRALAISSIAAFGGTPEDGSPTDEGTPPMLPFPSTYSATKYAGEMAFREEAREGLRLNVVYPSLVYGPPSKKGGINSFLRLIIAGRLPAVVGADRISTWVYLEDLVDGIVRVMERAEPGRDYLMTGARAATSEVVERVCQLAGVRRPVLTLPVAVARLLLLAAMPVELLSRRRLPFNNQQLRSLARHWNFDDSRAQRELGWTRRSLEEGLPPTVEFLERTIRRKTA